MTVVWKFSKFLYFLCQYCTVLFCNGAKYA